MTDTELDDGGTALNEQDRAVLAAAGVSERPESVRALAGGFANRMLRVDSPACTVVLRQWTRDRDAAAVEVAALREARGDGLPVPEVLAAQGNRAVLSYVDGEPASAMLPRCTRAQAEHIGERVGELYTRVWDRPRHPAGLAVAGSEGLEFAAWEQEPGAMFEDFLDRAWLAPAGWVAFAGGYAEAMTYYTARPATRTPRTCCCAAAGAGTRSPRSSTGSSPGPRLPRRTWATCCGSNRSAACSARSAAA